MNSFWETIVRTPTIHLNGTEADDLLAKYVDAEQKLRAALAALRRCAPHGRDYYLQHATPGYPGDASSQAGHEHQARITKLTEVQAEIVLLWQSVDKQKQARTKAHA
jgi:hypothetical protein